MLESNVIRQHPESEKLYCEKIDIGGEIRDIASGLQKFVKQEDMCGKVLVLANLPAVFVKIRKNWQGSLHRVWCCVLQMKKKIKWNF